MPIDWYITSPQMPSSSRSFNRSLTSRAPGGRCDISAIVSPVLAFFAVNTLGSLRVKLLPSTSTSSSSSPTRVVLGMRSACDAGMI